MVGKHVQIDARSKIRGRIDPGSPAAVSSLAETGPDNKIAARRNAAAYH
jgi:hypothetical protein